MEFFKCRPSNHWSAAQIKYHKEVSSDLIVVVPSMKEGPNFLKMKGYAQSNPSRSVCDGRCRGVASRVVVLGRWRAMAAAAAHRTRVEMTLWWLSLTNFFVLRGQCDVGRSPRPFLCSGEHRNMVRDGGLFDLGFCGVGGTVWWSTSDEMKSSGGGVILPCTTSGRWSGLRLANWAAQENKPGELATWGKKEKETEGSAKGLGPWRFWRIVIPF
jgi:hypothetical protein